MSLHPTTTRRRFVQTTIATSVAATLPAALRAGEQEVPPSERIALGVIGHGPRCRYVLNGVLPHADVQVVALADVQAERREEGKQRIDEHYGNQDCKLYSDFREILERTDIDAVLIATGDRWHSEASIMAAKAGKDVYSEKPCGITIEACQKLSDAIREHQRVFQAGTQRRSVANFHEAVRLVHEGKLGRLHTMYASAYMPVLENNWLPMQAQPAKEICDWNMWLGPAAWRPYNKQYVTGGWRGQWDFDSGARLLDWAAHTVDLCQWANQADDTLPIEYEPTDKSILCRYRNGVQLVIDFLADPFGNRDPHYVTRLGTCPVRFVGDEGSVETGDSGEVLVSNEALAKELPDTKRVQGLDVNEHARNFFDCIKSRSKPNANAEVMRRSHIAAHAAALSWVLGRKLTIDPLTETFVDDAEANLMRSRSTRTWA